MSTSTATGIDGFTFYFYDRMLRCKISSMLQPQSIIGEPLYTPELNMLKIFPKILSGIPQNFHLLCSSVLPSCLGYVPRVAIFLTIFLEHFNQ